MDVDQPNILVQEFVEKMEDKGSDVKSTGNNSNRVQSRGKKRSSLMAGYTTKRKKKKRACKYDLDKFLEVEYISGSDCFQHDFSNEVVTDVARRDPYCWYCHGMVANSTDARNISDVSNELKCASCPRSYHVKCVKIKMKFTCHQKYFFCPECVAPAKAENPNINKRCILSVLSLDSFSICLKYIVNVMKDKSQTGVFTQPVDLTIYNTYMDYVFYPMDLSTIEKRVDDKLYKCTQSFIGDVKWIVHNSAIFNRESGRPLEKNSAFTVVAKNILKKGQQEVAEMEYCPECYYKSIISYDDFFIEPCKNPHFLVEAKVYTYKPWPAKVLMSRDGYSFVKFFGSHEKAFILSKDCNYIDPKLNLEHEKTKQRERKTAQLELKAHVEELEKLYGKVEIFFDRLYYWDHLENLRLMLPGYEPPMVDFSNEKLENVAEVMSQRETFAVVKIAGMDGSTIQCEKSELEHPPDVSVSDCSKELHSSHTSPTKEMAPSVDSDEMVMEVDKRVKADAVGFGAEEEDGFKNEFHSGKDGCECGFEREDGREKKNASDKEDELDGNVSEKEGGTEIEVAAEEEGEYEKEGRLNEKNEAEENENEDEAAQEGEENGVIEEGRYMEEEENMDEDVELRVEIEENEKVEGTNDGKNEVEGRGDFGEKGEEIVDMEEEEVSGIDEEVSDMEGEVSDLAEGEVSALEEEEKEEISDLENVSDTEDKNFLDMDEEISDMEEVSNDKEECRDDLTKSSIRHGSRERELAEDEISVDGIEKFAAGLEKSKDAPFVSEDELEMSPDNVKVAKADKERLSDKAEILKSQEMSSDQLEVLKSQVKLKSDRLEVSENEVEMSEYQEKMLEDREFARDDVEEDCRNEKDTKGNMDMNMMELDWECEEEENEDVEMTEEQVNAVIGCDDMGISSKYSLSANEDGANTWDVIDLDTGADEKDEALEREEDEGGLDDDEKADKAMHNIYKMLKLACLFKYEEDISDDIVKEMELDTLHELQIIEIDRNNADYMADIRKYFRLDQSCLVARLKLNCLKAEERKMQSSDRISWCYSCKRVATADCCWYASYCSKICQETHFSVHGYQCSHALNKNTTAFSFVSKSKNKEWYENFQVENAKSANCTGRIDAASDTYAHMVDGRFVKVKRTDDLMANLPQTNAFQKSGQSNSNQRKTANGENVNQPHIVSRRNSRKSKVDIQKRWNQLKTSGQQNVKESTNVVGLINLNPQKATSQSESVSRQNLNGGKLINQEIWNQLKAFSRHKRNLSETTDSQNLNPAKKVNQQNSNQRETSNERSSNQLKTPNQQNSNQSKTRNQQNSNQPKTANQRRSNQLNISNQRSLNHLKTPSQQNSNQSKTPNQNLNQPKTLNERSFNQSKMPNQQNSNQSKTPNQNSNQPKTSNQRRLNQSKTPNHPNGNQKKMSNPQNLDQEKISYQLNLVQQETLDQQQNLDQKETSGYRNVVQQKTLVRKQNLDQPTTSNHLNEDKSTLSNQKDFNPSKMVVQLTLNQLTASNQEDFNPPKTTSQLTLNQSTLSNIQNLNQARMTTQLTLNQLTASNQQNLDQPKTTMQLTLHQLTTSNQQNLDQQKTTTQLTLNQLTTCNQQNLDQAKMSNQPNLIQQETSNQQNMDQATLSNHLNENQSTLCNQQGFKQRKLSSDEKNLNQAKMIAQLILNQLATSNQQNLDLSKVSNQLKLDQSKTTLTMSNQLQNLDQPTTSNHVNGNQSKLSSHQDFNQLKITAQELPTLNQSTLSDEQTLNQAKIIAHLILNQLTTCNQQNLDQAKMSNQPNLIQQETSNQRNLDQPTTTNHLDEDQSTLSNQGDFNPIKTTAQVTLNQSTLSNLQNLNKAKTATQLALNHLAASKHQNLDQPKMVAQQTLNQLTVSDQEDFNPPKTFAQLTLNQLTASNQQNLDQPKTTMQLTLNQLTTSNQQNLDQKTTTQLTLNQLTTCNQQNLDQAKMSNQPNLIQQETCNQQNLHQLTTSNHLNEDQSTLSNQEDFNLPKTVAQLTLNQLTASNQEDFNPPKTISQLTLNQSTLSNLQNLNQAKMTMQLTSNQLTTSKQQNLEQPKKVVQLTLNQLTTSKQLILDQLKTANQQSLNQPKMVHLKLTNQQQYLFQPNTSSMVWSKHQMQRVTSPSNMTNQLFHPSKPTNQKIAIQSMPAIHKSEPTPAIQGIISSIQSAPTTPTIVIQGQPANNQSQIQPKLANNPNNQIWIQPKPITNETGIQPRIANQKNLVGTFSSTSAKVDGVEIIKSKNDNLNFVVPLNQNFRPRCNATGPSSVMIRGKNGQPMAMKPCVILDKGKASVYVNHYSPISQQNEAKLDNKIKSVWNGVNVQNEASVPNGPNIIADHQSGSDENDGVREESTLVESPANVEASVEAESNHDLNNESNVDSSL